MKSILIVDHDPMLLQTLSGLLKSQSGMLEIITTDTSRRALEIIAEANPQIVVAGIHLPEVDGLQLLTQISQQHPTIRVIVMTANASPMFRATIKKMETAIHFDQTLDLNLLTKRIFTELQIDYGGQVRGIHLSSFLQMLELEERTCTMLISTKGRSGFLYMVKGVLVDAQLEALDSKNAALQILTWENVVIDLDYAPVMRPRTINLPLMALLMESGRIVDEAKSGRKNQRQHDRFDCLVAVDYNLSDLTYHCFLRDISQGGAYVETEQIISIGQKIMLAISAPNLPHCSIEAVVVRRDEKGIGIQFNALSAQQVQIINDMTSKSDPSVENT